MMSNKWGALQAVAQYRAYWATATPKYPVWVEKYGSGL